ncbi:hypothetical protein K469DRAFT_699585 [Zopfia rhizophila CBS 207.26]|uniref:DUF7924 domain-containing protein n=1 Tax=Zopfia rhizophila CBS 207.26 TaxID=1314779 RepID=A0A6A6EJA7_9PEZI|nr:hypothetical protein K469DRAFT_699585 [Zopfia rhizophila CBS 207.26]
MPITTSCPRPNYSLQRLKPFYIFFPFLTCEAQPGGGAHNITNYKNAHSTALAVWAVVELFWLTKREEEIDREILAFLVSYDNSSVSLYGHYPVIENKDTKIYTKTGCLSISSEYAQSLMIQNSLTPQQSVKAQPLRSRVVDGGSAI